jgi:hypothetical protein
MQLWVLILIVRSVILIIVARSILQVRMYGLSSYNRHDSFSI